MMRLSYLAVFITATLLIQHCSVLSFLPGQSEDEDPDLAIFALLALAGIGSAAAASAGGDTTGNARDYFVSTSLINGNTGTVHLHRALVDGSCLLEQTSSAAAGNNPYDLIIAPDGNHVYVANAGSSSITPYSIDYTAANLTALTNATVNGPAATVPYGMSVHPNGFLYVADGNASGSVGMFSRDAASGLLTGLSPNDFIAAGNYMWYSALSNDGNYLYASHFNGFGDAGNDSVYIYNVNTSTGALSLSTTVASQNQPWYVAVHPSGSYLYVSNYGSASISMYAINSATGALTGIGGGSVGAGTNPIGLAVGSSLAFVANNGAGTVFSYTIDSSTGALTFASSVNVGTPNPYGLALNSSGTCLYVAQTDESAGTSTDRISIYSVSSGGAMTLVDSLSAGTGPRFIARTSR